MTQSDELVRQGDYKIKYSTSINAGLSPNTKTLTNERIVRAHPSLLAESMRAGHVPQMRLYLLLKAVDQAGRGWLNVDEIRSRYAAGPGRVFGWRRLRQILTAGSGLFWERDSRGRVWLWSPRRIASALGVTRLHGLPVSIPIAHLTEGQHRAAASFLAAWHAGRGDGAGPVSRTTIETITGRSPSTQRQYDITANTSHQRNIAILCDHDNRAEVERHAWQRGSSTFKLVDHLGKNGERGKVYLAANLPSSYAPTLSTLPRGRQRKVNAGLQNLVLLGHLRGNDCNSKVLRVYHEDGAKAGSAYNRDRGEHTHLWRLGTTIKTTASTPPHLEGVALWGAIHSL